MTTIAPPPIWTNQAPHQIALDALQQFQWSVFPLDEEKKPPKTGDTHPDGQPKRLGWKRLQTRRASPKEVLYWQKTYHPQHGESLLGLLVTLCCLISMGRQARRRANVLG